MTQWLDGIATALAGFGIHPVLGASIIGLLVGLVLRSSRTARFGGGAAAPMSATVSREHGTGSLALPAEKIPLESGVLDAVVESVKGGRMVEAIKLVRAKTGLGLAESKHLVDAVAKSALR